MRLSSCRKGGLLHVLTVYPAESWAPCVCTHGFLARYNSSKNLQWVTSKEHVKREWGRFFGDFRPICRHISKTVHFYRAMHFSAYARSWDHMSSVRPFVRPSVRPSVTLVDCDHIGWKSWKLITRATSPTPSLFVAKRRSA